MQEPKALRQVQGALLEADQKIFDPFRTEANSLQFAVSHRERQHKTRSSGARDNVAQGIWCKPVDRDIFKLRRTAPAIKDQLLLVPQGVRAIHSKPKFHNNKLRHQSYEFRHTIDRQ